MKHEIKLNVNDMDSRKMQIKSIEYFDCAKELYELYVLIIKVEI
jgi:hypothetical protein